MCKVPLALASSSVASEPTSRIASLGRENPYDLHGMLTMRRRPPARLGNIVAESVKLNGSTFGITGTLGAGEGGEQYIALVE